MTTARKALPPKISLFAPPAEYKRPDEAVDKNGRSAYASHHGVYGGRTNSAATPYVISSPPISKFQAPQFTDAGNASSTQRPRLYQRRQQSPAKESLDDDNDEDEDDDYAANDNDSESRDQSERRYPNQTLSTIPEIPTSIHGTLTMSAILELQPPATVRRKKEQAQRQLEEEQKQQQNRTISSKGTIIRRNSHRKPRSEAHVAGIGSQDTEQNELSDFRYRRVDSDGFDAENRTSFSSSSASLPSPVPSSRGTSSSDDVSLWRDDQRRFTLVRMNKHSCRRRCLFVLVAMVVSVIIITVAVVIAVVLTTQNNVDVGATTTSTKSFTPVTTTPNVILNKTTPKQQRTQPPTTTSIVYYDYTVVLPLNVSVTYLFSSNVTTSATFQRLLCDMIMFVGSVSASNLTSCSATCNSGVGSSTVATEAKIGIQSQLPQEKLRTALVSGLQYSNVSTASDLNKLLSLFRPIAASITVSNSTHFRNGTSAATSLTYSPLSTSNPTASDRCFGSPTLSAAAALTTAVTNMTIRLTSQGPTTVNVIGRSVPTTTQIQTSRPQTTGLFPSSRSISTATAIASNSGSSSPNSSPIRMTAGPSSTVAAELQTSRRPQLTTGLLPSSRSYLTTVEIPSSPRTSMLSSKLSSDVGRPLSTAAAAATTTTTKTTPTTTTATLMTSTVPQTSGVLSSGVSSGSVPLTYSSVISSTSASPSSAVRSTTTSWSSGVVSQLTSAQPAEEAQPRTTAALPPSSLSYVAATAVTTTYDVRSSAPFKNSDSSSTIALTYAAEVSSSPLSSLSLSTTRTSDVTESTRLSTIDDGMVTSAVTYAVEVSSFSSSSSSLSTTRTSDVTGNTLLSTIDDGMVTSAVTYAVEVSSFSSSSSSLSTTRTSDVTGNTLLSTTDDGVVTSNQAGKTTETTGGDSKSSTPQTDFANDNWVSVTVRATAEFQTTTTSATALSTTETTASSSRVGVDGGSSMADTSTDSSVSTTGGSKTVTDDSRTSDAVSIESSVVVVSTVQNYHSTEVPQNAEQSSLSLDVASTPSDHDFNV